MRPDHAHRPLGAGGTGLVLVLLAATGFGLIPLVSRLAYAGGLSPEAAVIYRFAVPALPFLVFLRRFRSAREYAVSIGAGLFMGLGVLGYFRAIEAMPVAVAALIFFTFPLFAVLIGALVHRLQPAARALVRAGLVLVAAAVTVRPAELAVAPDLLLHAFLAPVAYATLILTVSHSLAGADRLATMAGLYVGTGLAALGLAAVTPLDMLLPSGPVGLAGALGLATVCGVLPQIALVLGAPRLGPSRTAVVGAFELPTALASGWLVLGEPLVLTELLAAALILAAIALAASARRSEVMGRETT